MRIKEGSPECLPDCTGACCHHLEAWMSEDEVVRLIENGSEVQLVDRNLVNGKRKYRLKVCYCLVKKGPKKGWCGDYKNRFEFCDRLTPGSQGCLNFRMIHPGDVKQLTTADQKFRQIVRKSGA